MKGFTLIEVIIAMFILIVGITGAIAFITRTTSVTGDVSLRFEAVYLAQEGIEIVRNIRDTNFLAIRKGDCDVQDDLDCWKKNGLTLADNCVLGCQADYNDTALTSFQDIVLNRDGSGFYIHGPGIPTSYKRKITITEYILTPERLQVDVEVSWQKGSVLASTELYDWLELPPPFRFNGQPTGILPAGTTLATISLETNINAECRYDDILADIDYDLIPNTFSGVGTQSHSEIITGLTDGTPYTYYVRCDALIGGKNHSDFEITFSVDTL